MNSARSDVAVVATLTPAKEIRAKADGGPLLPGRPCQFTISGIKHPKIRNLNVTRYVLPTKCSVHNDHLKIVSAQYGCSALR
jgi:hypothetical protein